MALKFVPPTQPTQARRLRSLLCRAPKGDGQASAAGATAEIITTAYTTDARRDARKGERCAARQPPKALCSAKSAGVLACETLGGGNFFGGMALKFVPPTQPTQARRLRSLLCRAPKGDSHASAVGATMAKITDAYTTDAGETPAIHASAAGATMAKITDAYTTTQARTPAFHASAVGATMAKITDAYTTDAGETPGRVNTAQPGNRRRRFATQRAQASRLRNARRW